jgi:1-acyl-sn-glycerol-3-phosphate acyltransferase
MDHVNYQYHIFSGYLLFIPRLISVVSFTLLSVSLINITEYIGYSDLSIKILNKYALYSTKLFGLTIHTKGEKHLSDKASILACNHINIYDHFVLTTVLNKPPSYLATNRFNVFPVTTMIKITNCLVCNPENKGNIVNKIKQRIKEGGQLFIYPDGCNPIPNRKLIAPFRNGAFVPKAPIQPIVIRYVSSSNTNMNWFYEDSSKDNTPFSLLKAYLLDGDIQVYVTILPVQYYKESYKSHEDYREDIYELMHIELANLPKQIPNLQVKQASNEYIMKYLLYLLYLSGFCYVIGNRLYSSCFFMNFIVAYFCHFYPTNNTCLIDSLITGYTFTKSTFISIQNDYDFYFRCLFMIFTLTRIYRWLQYRNDKPFDVKKHVWNTWIPMYTFTLYPLVLNTLELYNII